MQTPGLGQKRLHGQPPGGVQVTPSSGTSVSSATITNNLSVDIAYAGSHVVHVGIPDANINQLTQAQLATGLTNPTALTGKVTNPFFGALPAGSTLNTATMRRSSAHQTLSTLPERRLLP